MRWSPPAVAPFLKSEILSQSTTVFVSLGIHRHGWDGAISESESSQTCSLELMYMLFNVRNTVIRYTFLKKVLTLSAVTMGATKITK